MLTRARRAIALARGAVARDDLGYQLLRRVGRWLAPEYRFQWPQMDWWRDEWFNDYLRRFGELNGLNAGRRWTVYQLARLVAGVPGDTAECGVFEGAGSFLICAATQHQGGRSRTHYIVDSFEGLSEPDAVDGGSWRRGNLSCDIETVRRNLAGFDRLSWCKGWIPEAFGCIPATGFAFVHIDLDLYQPTRDSIEFFYPRMSTGGIIVCDDYGFTTCPGATKAIDDFLAGRPEQMIALPCGGGFLIKGAATAAGVR